MNFPEDLKYSKEHTWLRIDGNIGEVGITEFAQSELGEIVFADLPNNGYIFEKDKVFGSVEAVKTLSDLFYDESWMIKIEIADLSEVSNHLYAAAYNQLTGK